jgi:hypothetical protein
MDVLGVTSEDDTPGATPSDRLDLARKIRSLAGRLEELAPELDGPRDGRQQGQMLELCRAMKALAEAVIARPPTG